MLDICIIGGGASGLAAAITAARENPQKKVLIIEKKETAGRKLAATGNGKCNITNQDCCNSAETLIFFDTIGIYTRTDEEGRVYPYSSQAKDVVYALVAAAEAAGVEIRTDCTVEKVEKTENGFSIRTNKGTVDSKMLLIATGGKAAPQFGTTGDGYTFARQLGHTVNRLAPVLTGIEVNENLQPIKGVRAKALVKLLKDGKTIEQEYGEVQFNEDSISGICVMNLSRFIKLEDGESFSEGISRYSLEIDFVPETDHSQLENILKNRAGIPMKKPEDILLSIVPQQLRNILISGQENELCKLACKLKAWSLKVSGTKGWKAAQCTAGGVSLDEINTATMESELYEGLYFAGEVTDYDGPCGGYNLQYAWETGIKAGKAMANVL